MDIKLKDLNVGDEAVIVGFENKNQLYREKLLSFGLTKGANIKLIKFAPLGDPVEIEVRGFKLTLRKKESEILLLKRS